MAYKIAVGSSDGIHVDLNFGEVTKFLIYEVTDEIRLLVERTVSSDIKDQDVNEKLCNSSGCSGNGSGCNGSSDVILKVC